MVCSWPAKSGAMVLLSTTLYKAILLLYPFPLRLTLAVREGYPAPASVQRKPGSGFRCRFLHGPNIPLQQIPLEGLHEKRGSALPGLRRALPHQFSAKPLVSAEESVPLPEAHPAVVTHVTPILGIVKGVGAAAQLALRVLLFLFFISTGHHIKLAG